MACRHARVLGVRLVTPGAFLETYILENLDVSQGPGGFRSVGEPSFWHVVEEYKNKEREIVDQYCT